MSDPALAHALARLPQITARLGDWVRCASVSADPAHEAGMEAARRLAEGWLRAAGFARVERLEAGGHPAVTAEWTGAPGRPTLLVYGHYDVQPADPAEAWQSPPFAPEIRAGRLHGRGAADDKGPCLIAIEALAALLATEGRLPVNVKLLIEGEEELGSRSLGALLDRHRDRLAADAVLSADGARWRADLPTINVASRGMGGLALRLRTAGKDLHSGRYGGTVPNALHALVRLLATLHDAEGRVAVPGFYDGVVPPSAAGRAELAAIPFDAAEWLAAAGAEAQGEAGFDTLERLWLRPCLDVNGLWGGHAGPGVKTVIPAEAGARLTVRLVPGQEPEAVAAALRRHLAAACPPGARLEITDEAGWTAAHAVDPAHPLLAAAEASLAAVHGRRPLRVRIGATLPLADIVARRLGLDLVMFSFATADEDFHAPDEGFRLSAIPEGLAAWIDLLRRVGAQGAEAYAPFRHGHRAAPPAAG